MKTKNALLCLGICLGVFAPAVASSMNDDFRTTSLNWNAVRPAARRLRRVSTEVAAPVVPNAPTKEPASVAPPNSAPPTVAASPLVDERAVRVMIDPGHGGKDLGTHDHFGIVEKELTLDLGLQVRRELERHFNRIGAKIDVRLTRDEDSTVALKDRARSANDWNADLFVSIHANSSPVPKARGFEVYFLSAEASDKEALAVAHTENGVESANSAAGVAGFLSELATDVRVRESSRFAETVFQSLSQRISPNGLGVRQAPFAVLNGTQMPALLVEVGYVTHPEEAARLKKASYLKRVASAISTGVAEYALRIPKSDEKSAPKLSLGPTM